MWQRRVLGLVPFVRIGEPPALGRMLEPGATGRIPQHNPNRRPTLNVRPQNNRPIVMPFVLSVHASTVSPAGHTAGMPDGASGDADTINSGPKRAASEADLREHAVLLRKWRWCYCLRRSCEG
jgi:hypothetical protein